jgi:anti-sigma factor RsiW
VGGRIVDLLSTRHLATEALLPWLLNDTLTSDERSQVEAHLRSCAQCSAELAQQKQLQSHFSAAATPDPALDIDAAFARLLPRLDDQPVRSRRRPLWRPHEPVRWWQLGLAVQMGIILALGSALLLQLKPTSQNENVAAYRGLAATAQRASGDALVVFAPNTSEAQMRATLQRVGARIVDGPTAAGAFVVRFDNDPTAAMLASLRGDPTIARVESLSAQFR